MRVLILVLALAAAPPAAADTPNARTAYVERRGVLELDQQCGLFAPNVRQALQASTNQARGTLLRQGWSTAQVGELEQTVVAAARARTCQDSRTLASAADARRASATWIGANAMQFPGWQRQWAARRAPSPEGWRLSQAIDATATFGVRMNNGREQLTLTLPLASGQSAPPVRLVMRDPMRFAPVEVALPQRMALGLSAGAPAPAAATEFDATPRPLERTADGRALAVYVFPDNAFRDLIDLDPRESVEIEIGATAQSLLVEVGDVAVAREFLAIR